MQKPFEGIFGNSSELRLLEYLMPLPGIEFNVSELAEETGISRPTLTKIVKKFSENGILLARGGQITHYSINSDSPIVKTMEQLNTIIIEAMLGEDVLTEIGQYWSSGSTPIVPGHVQGGSGMMRNAAEDLYPKERISSRMDTTFAPYASNAGIGQSEGRSDDSPYGSSQRRRGLFVSKRSGA